ncbi:exodeoxyribonuclease V subunit gamma [Idiomarina aminovorans]|uniref:exodeoxyribonuclease V subunit gamma n=1 Tax=Idiomarina aminovorans TaxID=2914829 RepID=UPI002006B0DD|nr:exodeoxyribonuclease V subunit gamma [Idiomarina sp. ATCH4]
MSELTPGFIVAHGHRLEDLTDVAVTFTQNYPLAPLEQETVLVQSNGIAQWLKINLAQANGIAAMIDVTLPARFQWKAYRSVLGNDIPKTSPFDKDRLTWRLMRLLPELIEHNPHFAPLKHYTSDDADGRKLYQLSGRLADLFDQYAVYRADWLDNWVKSQDVLEQNQPVEPEQLWQPELWRAVSNDIGIDDYWNNRAELHQRFIDTAKALTERPAGLPPRVVVFGISSLPQQMLQVLDAIKGYTQILLCVHNPSQYHWADIVDGKEALRQAVQASSRLKHKPELPDAPDDDELHQLANPLLASWGKQGRDYIRLLDLYDETLAKQEAFNTIKLELFEPHSTGHLLAQLQDDILNLRPVHETRELWPTPAATDKSLQFHVCHSPQRELEVLHDQLLDAFANDPDLKPRDIMVMLPDVNTYAPYIDAVFGRYHNRFGERDPRAIPYTIADQGERHQRPLMIALELLLQVDQLRFTQTDLFNLLSVPAVQQRFGIGDDDLPQLKRWVKEAGARWGLSAQQRSQFYMPEAEETNSWWFGLKRMIAGYAMGELAEKESSGDSPWANVEPYAEVAGLSAALVGCLADVVRTLEQWWQRAQGEPTLPQWIAQGEWLLERFFQAEEDSDRLLLAKLGDELYQLRDICLEADNESLLRLPIFKDAWLERVDQQNLNQRFLAGAVNFATLMPMRAIPFKYVCVLGMNESDYPRSVPRVDFDLMTDRYRPGDRSRRDDDRYLFLEAMLSARDCFYLSWVGYSAKDNSERTPSVLVAQLRDHLQQGWGVDIKQWTIEHKLQPFNSAYFTSDADDQPYFTYASEWAQAHRGSVTSEKSSAKSSELAGYDELERTLSITDIKRFIEEPARLYFNWKLDTYFSRNSEDLDDSEAFVMDNLQSWALTSRLIESGKRALSFAGGTAGGGIEAALIKELNRIKREGALGIGAISEQNTLQLLEQTQDILDVYQQSVAGYSGVNEFPVEVGFEHAGLVIDDTVTGLHTNENGERLWVVTSASNIAAKNGKGINGGGWKHASAYYLGLLLLNLQQPTRLLIVSKGGCQLQVAPVPAELAIQQLEQILELVALSAQQPQPMHLDVAMTWLSSLDKKENDESLAHEAALQAYEEGGFNAAALLTSSDYCGRVAEDYSAIQTSPHFRRFINELYDPMRLTLVPEGQL